MKNTARKIASPSTTLYRPHTEQNPTARHPERNAVEPRDLRLSSNDKDPSTRQKLGRDDVGNAMANTANVENDRLTTAKNFADKLNDSRLWKIKISYQKRWTKFRRLHKSAEIQILKPWVRSTGPKTVGGKAKSALNTRRHTPLRAALDTHSRYLRLLATYTSLLKKAPGLAEKLGPQCLAAGHQSTLQLYAALRICSQKSR